MERRTLLPLVGLAVALAATAACSKAPSVQAPSAADTKIRVGVTVERTGPVPVLGLAQSGIEKAADYLNAQGGIAGKKIELIVRDNAGDPSRAIENVREFAATGVQFVVGPVFGQDCSAVAPLLATERLAGFCLSTYDLPPQSTNMYGIGVGYSPTIEHNVRWLRESGPTIGVLAGKDETGDSSVELVERFAPAVGAHAVVERFEAGDTSVAPQLQRLIAAGAQSIYLPACHSTVVTAAGQAVQLGFPGRVLLENCNAAPDVAQAVKGFANGRVFVMAPEFMLGQPAPGSPRHDAISTYQSVVVSAPQSTVAAGWDGMRLLAAAIEKADAPTADGVRGVLDAGFTYQGVWSAGTITAADHRGAVVDGALVPSVFTTEGTIVRAP